MDTTLPSLKPAPTHGPNPAWDDEDLVAECLRGNEQAWAAVVDKYKNLVYSVPLRYNMSPQDAAVFLARGAHRRPVMLRPGAR